MPKKSKVNTIKPTSSITSMDYASLYPTTFRKETLEKAMDEYKRRNRNESIDELLNEDNSIDSLLEDLDKKYKEKNEGINNKIFWGKGDNV